MNNNRREFICALHTPIAVFSMNTANMFVDFILGNMAKELATKDQFYKPFVDKPYNGTLNTCTIRTEKGKAISVQFDVGSPRPYSRVQVISGTKAIGQKYPEPARYTTGEAWLKPEAYEALEEKYAPPVIKKIGILRCILLLGQVKLM